MWTLEQLQDAGENKVCIDGKFVPARPENYKNRYLTVRKRIKRAWAVFTGKADTFVWPGGQ